MERIDLLWQTQSVVHPLDILKDEIEARGMSQSALAEAMGMRASNLSRLFKQRGEITASMALRLEQALGIPAEHWVGYQVAYYRDLIRLEPEQSPIEQIATRPSVGA